MGLARYAIKRAVHSLMLIFFVVSVNFLLFRLMPGNPVTMILDPRMKPEMKAHLMHIFGLDRPIWEQYLLYIKNLFTGDLGYSFMTLRPVSEMIMDRLPWTLALMIPSTVLSLIIGTLIGIYASWKREGLVDLTMTVTSMIFYSMPVFWLGGILMLFFSVELGLFPVAGAITPGAAHTSIFDLIKDVLWHATLPMLALTLITVAYNFMLARDVMLDAISQDFILTAKAKGVSEKMIVFKHAFRNALLPITTNTVLSLAATISGAVLTETVFSWPGLGTLTFQAVEAHDYPLLQGLFFIYTVVTIISIYFLDLAYGFIDPRIRR
jgi:peptide/nickel transport system permease protein